MTPWIAEPEDLSVHRIISMSGSNFLQDHQAQRVRTVQVKSPANEQKKVNTKKRR